MHHRLILPNIKYLSRVDINSTSIFDCEHFRRMTWRRLYYVMQFANVSEAQESFECVSNMYGKNPPDDEAGSRNGGLSGSANTGLAGGFAALAAILIVL